MKNNGEAIYDLKLAVEISGDDNKGAKALVVLLGTKAAIRNLQHTIIRFTRCIFDHKIKKGYKWPGNDIDKIDSVHCHYYKIVTNFIPHDELDLPFNILCTW